MWAAWRRSRQGEVAAVTGLALALVAGSCDRAQLQGLGACCG